MTSREDENTAALSSSPQKERGENGAAREEARRSDAALPSGAEAASLRALKEGLSKVPHDEKSALVHVQRVAPELADNDHLLAFLRGEHFDVNLALKRLLSYWSHRYEIFGPQKYALPMTLSGAMRDQLQALRDGCLTLLPVCDEAGRSIIYENYARPVPEVEEKLRILWYLLHTIAMQDPVAQRNGYVFLSDSRGRINGFNPKWAFLAKPVCNVCFPIQWKYVHICHTNAVFPLMGQTVAGILSREQLRSFFMHNGTEEQVLENLSEYGLSKHCVPEGLGGTLHVSTEAFAQYRLAIEGSGLELNDSIGRSNTPNEEYDSQSNPDTEDEAAGNDTCNFDHASRPKLQLKAAFEASLDVIYHGYSRHEDSHASNIVAETLFKSTAPDHTEERRPETEESKGLPMPSTSLGHHQLKDSMIKTAVAENSFTSLVQQGTLAKRDNSIEVEHDSAKLNLLAINVPSEKQPPDQSTHKSSKPKQRKDNRSETHRKRSYATANAMRGDNPTHGRNGDPRMNRAVQAKVNNPDLTLVGALVAGGFMFPNLSAPGVSIGATLDEDGISVYQRRNQLMRRLRYINKKSRVK